MGAKTSINLDSFHNSEFCDNYTFDIESSNHIVMPPQEPIQEGEQPPPPEPIQEGDDDYDMPPPEPIQDDDDDMPPLEPIQEGDADYDDMPPLEPIQDDDDMPPLEPIQDGDADYDMPPPESIHRFLQLCNNNNSGLRYDTTNFSGFRSDSATFEVSSEEAFCPLPNFSGGSATFEVSSEEAFCPLPEPTSSPIVFTNDTVVNTVIQSFISRSNLGFKKYNNTLDRDDLSTLDWVNHTQEELMDAILYLERLKKNL